MNKNKQRQLNQLEVYRRRMGFTPDHVATLLQHCARVHVLEYERGERWPSLVNGLCLGIILRVPVEFLFGPLYDRLREEIRQKEELINQPTQQVLF